MITGISLKFYWVPIGFPMDFHWYFIHISIGLDFQRISNGVTFEFNWNSNWYFIDILNGFWLKFYWISIGFPMDFHWYLFHNSIGLEFQLDFQWNQLVFH